MRVKPSAAVAIAAIVGYLAVVFAVWLATGIKYDEVGDTVENVRKSVVLAVGLGSVYLIVVTLALGWWKPAMREPRKVQDLARAVATAMANRAAEGGGRI